MGTLTATGDASAVALAVKRAGAARRGARLGRIRGGAGGGGCALASKLASRVGRVAASMSDTWPGGLAPLATARAEAVVVWDVGVL